jgi:hypothetical protein
MRNETPLRGLTVEPALGMATLRFECLSRVTEIRAGKALPCGQKMSARPSLERRVLSDRRKLHAHCADRGGEDFSIYFQQFAAFLFTHF